MGLRFSRRVRLIPGLRVNLIKSGASLSIGHRGLWYTIGPRGRRVTVGLPGSGLFWTKTERYALHPPERHAKLPEAQAGSRPPHAGHRAAFVFVVVLALIALYAIVGHPAPP